MPTTTTTKTTPAPNRAARRHPSPVSVLPAFVTLADAATYAGVDPRTLRRAVSRGELSAYALGKTMGTRGSKGLRVRLSDVEAWITSRALPTATAAAR